MHSVIAVIGVLLAAGGSVVLLAQAFRAPRGDLIAWSIGLLGLLVSLGSQALGYLTGFDPAIFRGMEISGQVIAPLAFTVALWNVAGRSPAARFCARLYVGAVGLVSLVVLALDQLTTARFGKAWPPPLTFYQALPNYVLMYVTGIVMAALTAWAVLLVLSRSGEPGWSEAVPGQLLGGAAALALAYPGIAEFAAKNLSIHLPLGSVFTVVSALAALLAWRAGVLLDRLPLAAMHGRDYGDDYALRHGMADGYGPPDGYPPDDYGRDDYGPADSYPDRYDWDTGGVGRGAGYDRPEQEYATGDFDRQGGMGEPDYLDRAGEPGLYRPDPLYQAEDGPGEGYGEFSTGDFDAAALGDAAAGSGWGGDGDGWADHFDDRAVGRRRDDVWPDDDLYPG
ncbi:MAG: hypothetical protein J2P28_17960 [Actinobacteria bacterium]|nr:hypothetical protein [Actinomycetota bacterium]